MIDDALVQAHRGRALSPDHPFIRGTAQNPDVYFQGRETVNPYYQACPHLVQNQWIVLPACWVASIIYLTNVGSPTAERVIVMMGSGAETAGETAQYLVEHGENVGVLKVRLYRPFPVKHFLGSPASHGQGDRGVGPHKRTGCCRRATLYGCGYSGK